MGSMHAGWARLEVPKELEVCIVHLRKDLSRLGANSTNDADVGSSSNKTYDERDLSWSHNDQLEVHCLLELVLEGVMRELNRGSGWPKWYGVLSSSLQNAQVSS